MTNDPGGTSPRLQKTRLERFLAEPMTALSTIPFEFTPILWEASWLVYPLAVKLLERRSSKAI